jgi:hypothetical protein
MEPTDAGDEEATEFSQLLAAHTEAVNRVEQLERTMQYAEEEMRHADEHNRGTFNRLSAVINTLSPPPMFNFGGFSGGWHFYRETRGIYFNLHLPDPFEVLLSFVDCGKIIFVVVCWSVILAVFVPFSIWFALFEWFVSPILLIPLSVYMFGSGSKCSNSS